MANVLKMATIDSIVSLIRLGYSDRRIAADLSVDRGTVRKYRERSQNPPGGRNAPSGSEFQDPPNAPAGLEGDDSLPAMSVSAAQSIRPGPESACAAYHEIIVRKLDTGLSAQRIWQDLRDEFGFAGKYPSVRRYVRRLALKSPELVRRIEVHPGEEAQIDFGTGAWVTDADGKRRRPWVLRVVLSHSRKGYCEAVYHQTTDNFIRVLENAFRYFGGTPKTLVIDNLKAAVK